MNIKSQQLKFFWSKGFTLIEALTLLFIFSVITVTFYAVFSKGTEQIIETKNRLGALAVANEKMEIVRNLDYASIGTTTGIPAGDILQYESVTVNTRTFSVHTIVQYVDDPFDGKVVGTTPLDSTPNDYKFVKIEVSWGTGGMNQKVMLVSTFVPKGVEVSGGGGTLSINVIDNTGTGVPSATIHITNTSVTPNVDTTTNTDSAGNLMLFTAKASDQAYKIEVSKNGYYGVTTYAPYPISTFKPVDIHVSVVEAAFNQKTIVMDKSSDISIATKDAFGADLPNIGFHLLGGRKIGDTTATSPVPVFSLDQNTTSGTNAKKDFGAQSSGMYTLTLADARYQLLRLSAPDSLQSTFSAGGGLIKDEVATIIDTQMAATLVVVKNDAPPETAILIPGASVHLSNTSLGYDTTVVTDQYGQAYFPTAMPMLVAGTYDYTVTVAGYADKTGTIVITTDLKIEDVKLTAL